MVVSLENMELIWCAGVTSLPCLGVITASHSSSYVT
jgi:hypothetical protein